MLFRSVPILAIIMVCLRGMSLKVAVPSILSLLFMSDILLSPATGFAAFGYWSIFTYSGYLALTLFVLCNGKNWQSSKQLLMTVPCGFAYWLWTNFGTWVVSGMYQHNIAGLSNCFIQGLPFLRNAVLGDLLWVASLLVVLRAVSELKKKQSTVQKALS